MNTEQQAEEPEAAQETLLELCHLLKIMLEKHHSPIVSKSLSEITKVVVYVIRKLELQRGA